MRWGRRPPAAPTGSRGRQKLGAYAKRIPMDVSPAVAPLAMVNPLAGARGLATMFSTHPSTEERVARLLQKDIALGENILLIGEAGVGKNKLESYLASLLRWNLLVIGMSGETRVSDLLTYRSFGEEEAGRTGDTATLGLKALTDEDQQWMIVLDQANKAQQGVLVSFNDLLQDRLVRLPGGAEVPVRATICVNIIPNRPPYEVNDFSFDFMDRFSIHTIVHLPPDQAADVLAKKYPQADVDFIRDVVNGYYALHPLYSGGVLFEPVTMRNEETAIERGLQSPLLLGRFLLRSCEANAAPARPSRPVAGGNRGHQIKHRPTVATAGNRPQANGRARAGR